MGDDLRNQRIIVRGYTVIIKDMRIHPNPGPAWRVVAADVDGAQACLRSALAGPGDPGREAAEVQLAGALRHPSRITEQLVALRATQSLTLLDLRNYLQQVWTLGGYGADGDREPAPLPGSD